MEYIDVQTVSTTQENKNMAIEQYVAKKLSVFSK
jgi:hypothetical protein